jgi:hypothetical protein
VQALRGNDVVGSSVRIKLKKPSGKTFECTLQRGSIARIEANGELFLMLTEIIGDIENHKKIAVGDIMGCVSRFFPLRSFDKLPVGYISFGFLFSCCGC